MCSFARNRIYEFYFSVVVLCAIVVVIIVFDMRINETYLTNSIVNITNTLNGALSRPISTLATFAQQHTAASASVAEATIDPLVRTVFERQQAARQGVIARNLMNRGSAPELATDLHFLYHGLVPEVLCNRLVRIGNTDDGGKWVCDPWSLPTNCVLYSLGVGGDNTFERELAQEVNSRCSIWSFDNNAAFAALFTGMNLTTFRPWLIGPNTNASGNVYAMLDVMKQFNHTYLDILKIDIESSEYKVVPDLLANVTATNTTFCHLLIEMHGLASKQTWLLQMLAKAEYLMYSYEVNGWDHNACEYSLIHRSCMEQYGMHQVLQRNFAV